MNLFAKISLLFDTAKLLVYYFHKNDIQKFFISTKSRNFAALLKID